MEVERDTTGADKSKAPESIGAIQRSASMENLAKALSGFQSEVGAIPRDGANPFFKSKYATLENIVTTIRPGLSNAGLAFSQLPCGESELTTLLLHQSGEYIASTVKMPPKEKTPQGQGSAISYMRRYALSAILGIVTDEDDDGNEASRVSTTQTRVSAQPSRSDPHAAVKASIQRHLRKLRGEVTKDNVRAMVQELTGLELVQGSYQEINSRLAVLVNDRGEAERAAAAAPVDTTSPSSEAANTSDAPQKAA